MCHLFLLVIELVALRIPAILLQLSEWNIQVVLPIQQPLFALEETLAAGPCAVYSGLCFCTVAGVLLASATSESFLYLFSGSQLPCAKHAMTLHV